MHEVLVNCLFQLAQENKQKTQISYFDLGTNCLQRLSAEDTRRLRVKYNFGMKTGIINTITYIFNSCNTLGNVIKYPS